LLDNALSPLKDKVLLPPQSASTDDSQTSQKPSRPEIVIPSENERTADGGKCYLHLVKERLMGLYLSVYVYKGCEKLVQGECASAPKSLSAYPLLTCRKELTKTLSRRGWPEVAWVTRGECVSDLYALPEPASA
jgi:hypothetical protein